MSKPPEAEHARESILNIRMMEAEKEDIVVAATRDGMPPSRWARQILNAEVASRRGTS